MCLLRVVDVNRPVLTYDVVFINYEDFVKLGDETYIRVLTSDKKWDEISKSYFYFIVNKLRSLGLLIDNALSFKVLLPYKPSYNSISVTEGISFITKDKKLIYYDAEKEAYKCGICPVSYECLSAVKSLARETGAKIRNEELDTAWFSLIQSVKSHVMSNLRFLRAKADLDNLKVKDIEWVKERL
ncbi:hypothetical protein [Stygiolobus caldivivus]|uniref:Uncharacterized protein n=1 Tax=Stygiolobus caldivivus TaxID=2824673 RepID=A0A8D5U5E2_9CREN|nr:hypothetical protein [Stygiolobus caldivivus]BCU69619.1 hypothetical protein KN1_09160 [Stygiolobus caldivivus]